MDEKEFVSHVFLILKLASHPQKRIILDSYAYSKKQQITINEIRKNTKNIIGQLNMDLEFTANIREIRELIESYPEERYTPDQLQYHILWNENRN